MGILRIFLLNNILLESSLWTSTYLCFIGLRRAQHAFFCEHYDVMTWKRFPRNWPFVRGMHRSLVDSPHKGPVMWGFDVYFAVSLNKLLNKWTRCRWIEMYWCSLNIIGMKLQHFQTYPKCWNWLIDWLILFHYSDSMIHSTWYISQHKVVTPSPSGLISHYKHVSGHIRVGKLYISISWQLTSSQGQSTYCQVQHNNNWYKAQDRSTLFLTQQNLVTDIWHHSTN